MGGFAVEKAGLVYVVVELVVVVLVVVGLVIAITVEVNDLVVVLDELLEVVEFVISLIVASLGGLAKIEGSHGFCGYVMVYAVSAGGIAVA